MKNLEYYMALPYRIEIHPIPEDQGGGYEACIPELGRYAVVGDGETIEEALANLETVKKDRLSAYLEEGLVIPEPDPEEAAYSGRFLVRIPKYLHRELALNARKNGVSLNQFITALLSGCLNLPLRHSGPKNLRSEGIMPLSGRENERAAV